MADHLARLRVDHHRRRQDAVRRRDQIRAFVRGEQRRKAGDRRVLAKPFGGRRRRWIALHVDPHRVDGLEVARGNRVAAGGTGQQRMGGRPVFGSARTVGDQRHFDQRRIGMARLDGPPEQHAGAGQVARQWLADQPPQARLEQRVAVATVGRLLDDGDGARGVAPLQQGIGLIDRARLGRHGSVLVWIKKGGRQFADPRSCRHFRKKEDQNLATIPA